MLFCLTKGQKEVITQFSQNHLEVLNVHSMCYIALNIYFEFSIEEGEKKVDRFLFKNLSTTNGSDNIV